jgi:hypothetical protein
MMTIVEVVITLGIATAAVYIFVKNIKKKSQAGCDCGSCSEHCPNYKTTKK